jgi:hypothetical protein
VHSERDEYSMYYIEETLSDGTTVRMAEGFATAEEAHGFFSAGYWRERAGSARIKRDHTQEGSNTSPLPETHFHGETQRVRVSILPRDGFIISEKMRQGVYEGAVGSQCWTRILGKTTYQFEVYMDEITSEPWVFVNRARTDQDGWYWDPVKIAPLSNFVPESAGPEYNVPSEYTTYFTEHSTFYVGDADSGNGVLLEVEVVGTKTGTDLHHYARQDFKWRIVDNRTIVIGGTYTSKATPLTVWDVASRVVESLTLENYEEDEYIPFHHSVSRESRDWVYRAQSIFTHPHGIV